MQIVKNGKVVRELELAELFRYLTPMGRGYRGNGKLVGCVVVDGKARELDVKDKP